MKRNPFFIALLFALFSASFSFAATITWTNTAGGNWSVAANWSPNQVPTAADTAQITTSGTYSVTNSGAAVANVLTLGGTTGTQTLLLSAGTMTLGSASTGNAQAVLNITGGILGGVGSLVLAGPLNWSGGSITNSVQFSGGGFSGTLNLNGGQVINTGTLNWTSASINVGNGSVISNVLGATINLSANLNEGALGGTHTFNNAGTINVAVSGTASIGDIFNSTASVVVSNGTFNLTGGGTETGALFFAFPGGTNQFGGGTFSLNSNTTITGFGTWVCSGAVANFAAVSTISNATVNISGGTVNFNESGSLVIPALNQSSGTLAGTNPVMVSGAFTWSGGSIVTNLVQFNGGTFSGTPTLNNGAQVVNTGILSWTAAGFDDGNGSIISNAPSGTINMTANLGEGSFGGVHTFNNAGQLNVTVSTTAIINDVFNNSGAVAVNGGTLDLTGGGSASGSFTAASGATLDFGSGTFSINNTSTISGAGNFTVAGAIITIPVGLNLGGTWTFSGGTTTLAGSTTVSGNAWILSGGTVSFSGTGPWNPATLTFSSGTLEGSTPVIVQNAGGMTWSGGNVVTNLVQFNGGTFSGTPTINNGGQVVNTGVLSWNAAGLDDGNGSIISNAPTGTINMTANLAEGSFGGVRTFNNAGQLNVAVSAAANISDVFNNSGSVTVNGGTLDLSGGGTGSGSFTAASGTTLDFGGGTYSINNTSTISGAGNFTVAGAIITIPVGLNLGGTWTFSGGTATLAGTTTVSGNPMIISGGTVNLSGTGPWKPATLAFSGGTLEGSTPLIVQNSGGLTWTGGTILTNLLQFVGGSVSGSMSLNNGGQLVNAGSLNWTATTLDDGNGSLISNAPAGTFNLTVNLSEGSFGGTRTFNNAGQLNVTVPGTANISEIFNSSGTVAISGGTLNLSGGGTETGSITVASGTTNEFGSGTFSMIAGATISGAGVWLGGGGVVNFTASSVLGTAIVDITGGTVNFNNTTSLIFPVLNLSGGGILAGSNPVTVSGPFTWSGGTIVTNLVQFNGGSFSNSFSINNGGQVINTGTLNWTATTVDDGNGSIISNAPTGIINLATNLSEGSFGGTRTFNNGGQLNVAVTGTANIGDNFTNTGTITFNSGILNLSGTHNLAGGTLNFGINALNNYGSNILAGAAGLGGTLKSRFNGSYLPSVGNTYNVMTYGSSSGVFAVTNLSPLAVWQVNQNTTALSITVLKLVPQVAWATPADIVYGTALSGSQLIATATWNGTNVPGVFNYTPVSGTVLNSGSNQLLSVTFVPTDPSTFVSASSNVLINVQKAPLAVTATNITKTYGQTYTFAGTEFTTSGLVNGDVVTSATLSSPGAAPTANVAGSPYAITINNAVGDAGLTNYNISYTGAQLSVGPANLGITAKNQTKIYGQVFTFTGTEFTPAGLQNSETVGSVTLTSLGAPATASVAGSPYNIVPSAATGGTFDPNNYSINYFNGALTVNKASLTIMADNTNKIVGESLTFAGNEFTASGLQNSETVGSVTLASTGAPAAAGVGGYPIVPSAPTGGTFSQGNYANSFVNGTLNVVAPPPLSIVLNGNQDILTFQAMLGQSYQVQTETNLTLSSWTPLGSPISSKNGIVNVTNNISVPPGFYRLQIQLGP